MNLKITVCVCAGMFLVNILYANGNPFPNLRAVEGEEIWTPSPEIKMRDICFTNVFHSISTNGFIMTDFFERNLTPLSRELNETVFVEGADFRLEGSDVLFEVGYYTTTDKNEGGSQALSHSMYLYSTMMPPWFKQHVDGPGNICLLPRGANVNDPTKIRNVFFARDNVAVRVRNSRGGDVLAFVKLLDDCILASSVEETKSAQK